MNNIKKYLYVRKSFMFLALIICLFFTINSNLANGANKNIQINKNEDIVRFVQVSDAHFTLTGKNYANRKLKYAPNILNKAIQDINKIKGLNFVIFSGDLVNNHNQSQLDSFLKVIRKLNYPWYAALGNHDIDFNGKLTKTVFMGMLNKANPNIPNNPYYIFYPKEGWAFIALDGVKDTISANGEFDRKQLIWLDETLKQNKEKKVVIFQHYPVIEPYKSITHKVLNAEEYLDIIKSNPNVIAVLAGHYHGTKVEKKDGVIFVTTPSLIEFPYAYRYYSIEDIDNKIIFHSEVRGVNFKALQYRFAQNCQERPLNCGTKSDRNSTIVIPKRI